MNFRALAGVDDNKAFNPQQYPIHVVDAVKDTAERIGLRLGVYQNVIYAYNASTGSENRRKGLPCSLGVRL